MSSKPDEINDLGNGWREEIRYRRRPGVRNERARMRKLVGPDGKTRQMWHEVVDAAHNIVHQHEIAAESSEEP